MHIMKAAVEVVVPFFYYLSHFHYLSNVWCRFMKAFVIRERGEVRFESLDLPYSPPG
ncbi:hypothetical protein NTGM5_770008 [Candidatus Nitrotoga sp. M5]|nr:hypothetical protein NTGM5_770008 [Candidatus Nitrotoga sp. M5]